MQAKENSKGLKRYTIVTAMDNEAGVLSQLAHLFSRKGYNIETIAAGWTADQNVTRFTIEIYSDEERVQLLCSQLRKLVPIHYVEILDPRKSIRRELMLVRVHAADRAARNEIIQISNIFRGSVIDITSDSITVSVTGDDQKTGAFEALLKEFGIIELARTGIVAMERGEL
ncbi:MAG: acetolactate synthase small subunit [Synergistaceae bacterium]|nr:acetolactate synthase small subunit [Synergistaceae bacterium]MBR0035409.1 acetolactate synthase small subunit [Synergistaceae bacterium]